jgi:uncharacterized protein
MVPLSQIRAYAKRIAEEFKPRRIIFFGSHAYGTPGPDSDVDIMVVMDRVRDGLRAAVDIRLKIDAPFPLDLLVRSEAQMRARYEIEDWFIREKVDRGKVIYEAGDGREDSKSRGRLSVGRTRITASQ